MSNTQPIATTEAHYQDFIKALTALTRQYGVAIQSVGGVILADQVDEFNAVSYIADSSSGDLYPQLPTISQRLRRLRSGPVGKPRRAFCNIDEECLCR